MATPLVQAQNDSVNLSQQQRDLASTYLTGANTQACVRILNGGTASSAGNGASLLAWSNIFNTAYWIPVVPTQCVVCSSSASQMNGVTGTLGQRTSQCPYGEGQSVPLSLNLIPHIIIRLYGLLASITLYGLILVFAIIGIRYLIGGLAKGGRYTDTAKNLRDVFSAAIITLTVSTLFLQVLYSVLQIRDENALRIQNACIPTIENGNTVCR